MDNYMDWLRKLQDDLIEQFRGQPNIAIFNKAVARQFNELYAFFYQLYVLQWLDQAEGAQLDGIGNIVDLSRTDALIWSNLAGQNVPMDDDLYRMYLWFKIFLNTSEGTYGDIMKTLELFWPHTPIYYSEYVDIPATMFFTLPLDSIQIDTRVLGIVTRVKAAGVALHFVFTADAIESDMFIAGALSEHTEDLFVPADPPGELDAPYYLAGVINEHTEDIFILPNPSEDVATALYLAGAINEVISDVFRLADPSEIVEVYAYTAWVIDEHITEQFMMGEPETSIIATAYVAVADAGSLREVFLAENAPDGLSVISKMAVAIDEYIKEEF